jgi:hypothetical protein
MTWILRRLGELSQNMKISSNKNLGYYKSKQHKPWFNKGCSGLLDQRKQAKLQWLQDPSQINGDDLNNVWDVKSSGAERQPSKIITNVYCL